MPFLRFWTCYKIAVFESEKTQNESRFAPAWITYFLKLALGGQDKEMNFELWSEGLGIMPLGKKKKLMSPLTKKEEVAKGEATLDFILNGNWGESGVNAETLSGKPRITRMQG